MTRIRLTDISPDGVRIFVDWDKFVPGASVFIPAINTIKAIDQAYKKRYNLQGKCGKR